MVATKEHNHDALFLCNFENGSFIRVSEGTLTVSESVISKWISVRSIEPTLQSRKIIIGSKMDFNIPSVNNG